MMFEERLARLEETLFFQERLLNDLNDALGGQQKQLDVLERALEKMRAGMEDPRLAVEEGTGSANVPPPHYQER